MSNSSTNALPVRIALVGLGGHGRTIQGAVQAARGLEVVGVFDPHEAEAALASERFGCYAAPSYEALIAREGLDAVSLCSPNSVHRPQAEAAFAAGLDVLVEKPIANTVADGLAMVEAAEAAGRVLMVGHNMRFSEAIRWGKSLLDAGRLGEVVSAEFHFSSDTALRLPEASWRLRPDQCPLLPMMQLGIHGVDLIHYLLGAIASVFASARAVITGRGAVDNVAASFTLDDGTLGTMVSNYCSPVHFALRVAGTEGTLHGTPLALTFQPRDGDPRTCDTSADGFASYTAQVNAFAQAIRLRAAPETDGWAGLQALAVVEAMTESIAQYGPVAVPTLRPTTAADHAS